MSETVDLQLIAFLDIVMMDDKESVRGGVLVTDLETKPYEFRCTGSVLPTKLQRILYGSTLDGYIFVDLIGRPLLKAAKEKPVLVIVQSKVLLQVRPTVEYPIVLLQKPHRHSSNKNLPSMHAHPAFADEIETAHRILDPLIEKCDLFEPFERLRVALEEAHRQRIGDKQRSDG